MMTLSEFRLTLVHENPPKDINQLLIAMWYDAKGNWEMAHNLVSEIESPDASSVHAYLHRKEGDISNAEYWYRRAGEKRRSITLEQEADELVSRFLDG